MSNLIGQTLGPYRIIEQIGIGGMATVYKAYQPSMDRYVAIKVLPALVSRDPAFLKRFRREAKMVAKLEHKHILPVHDYGEQEGLTYLVMRYVEAGTLKGRLAAGQLDLPAIYRIIAQVGAALDYAHRLGVIHRDVKPSNVLVDSQGDAYLTDFGLARIVEGSEQLTKTGVGVGTPDYMAPEQGQGLKIDHRSDIYSLGVMLYEMATGRVPYQAETPMAVVIKHISAPLPLPSSVKPDIPPQVERVILKAMAKDPDDRFQTVAEMVTALDAAVRVAQAEAPAAVGGPAVAKEAAPPSKGFLARAAAGVGEAMQTGWGRTVMWAAVGIVALLAFFLALSRVPLKVQIRGGQLEVVRVVEATITPEAAVPVTTPTEAVAAEATATPAPTRMLQPAATPTPDRMADQAHAFAEPILAAIANRAPDYEDDFSDPASGWDVGGQAFPPDVEGETGYIDGEYFLIAAPRACIGSAPPIRRPPSDFVLEVEGRFVSGDRGEWVLHFRQWRSDLTDKEGKYAVMIQSNGQIDVYRFDPESETPLGQIRRVKSGTETNSLRLIAVGPEIALYANGEPVFYVSDSGFSDRFRSGDMLLVVCNKQGTTPLRVQFDNLKIWDISDLALPSAEATPAPQPTATPTPTPRPAPTPIMTSVPVPLEPGERLSRCRDDLCIVDRGGGSTSLGLAGRYVGLHVFSWSPDGQRIAFSGCDIAQIRDPKCRRLYLADRNGDNVARVLPNSFRHEFSPAWSPDGQWIAYHDGGALSVVRPDGTGRREVAPHPYCPANIAWSSDSQRVAWLAHWCDLDDSSPALLWVINLDGSDMRFLWQYNASPFDSHIAWSPDGQSVAVRFPDGTAYLVDPDCDAGPDGCDESSRTGIDTFPEHWLHTFNPQWAGETVVRIVSAEATPAPQPTATPTPRPSVAEQVRAIAEPILAAIADRPPDYKDDFSDPGSGWSLRQSTEGEAGYEDGEYVAVAAPGYVSGGESSLLPEFSDFVLEIDGRFVSGDGGHWGVPLRRWEKQSAVPLGYGVLVTFSGEVWIVRRGVGEEKWTNLTSVREPFIKPGYETNHLQIIVKGAQIAVAVNGEWATLVTDPYYTTQMEKGRIRLDADNDGGGTPLRVQWDNLKIWDISDLALP